MRKAKKLMIEEYSTRTNELYKYVWFTDNPDICISVPKDYTDQEAYEALLISQGLGYML